MSTNAIALRETQTAVMPQHSQVTEVQRLGGLLAASGYFSDAREMAQAAVKVMAGQELGIPPVAAMMGINIIKGKVALGGNLIASRIRAHGYDYRHKQFDNNGCVLEFLSKPDAAGKRTVLGDSSFTAEDAKAAQISSDMYKKFPRNMYFNRAISNGAKWYTPEVFAGAPVYVPEELGAKVDENGDMVHEEPTREQSKAAQKEVLDRKLADIQQRREAAQQEAVEQAQPSTLDQGLQTQQSTLDQMLSTFADPKRIEPAFAQMRQHFCSLLDETVYEAIMAEHGLGPGEKRTVGKAKSAYAALWNAYHRAMREQSEVVDAEVVTE